MEELVFISYPHLRGEAAWNLAVEEALHMLACEELKEKGIFNPIIRTYSFDKPSVILGYRQKIDEIDIDYCQKNGISVTMRKTGGGSVCLGSRDLQYTFILPIIYTKNLLGRINARIILALEDSGFSPKLKNVNEHRVIRLNDKSFVFDAQKRSFFNGNGNYKCALLHHGTILVDDRDYFSHLQGALKASSNILNELQAGNAWLGKVQQIKDSNLINALRKNLPFEASKVVRKDYPSDVIALARNLYEDFYSRPEKFNDGKKDFGICYRPSTPYNMELYSEKEEN